MYYAVCVATIACYKYWEMLFWGKTLTLIPAFMYYQESSILRIKFLDHANLVRYVQQCKAELIEAAGISPSNDPYFCADASSSASRGRSTSSKILLGFCECLLC